MVAAKQYVKLLSTVPPAFVDELFEFYKEDTLQTDFVVRLDSLAKWLKTEKRVLVDTLKRSYKLNFDYIRVKIVPPDERTERRANNYVQYMLTPDSFKRLAMQSKSKNAEMVRTYFIEVESLFLKYREQTLEGMRRDIQRLERNQKSVSVSNKQGYLYILRASHESDSLFKIGRTANLAQRLQTYDTGLADRVDLLYTYQTDDIVGAETCVKGFLRKYKYRKYKEVYQADLQMIKELMAKCGSIGAKLVQKWKKNRTEFNGGFFIVIGKNTT